MRFAISDECDGFPTAGSRENTIHSWSFWPTGKRSHGNRFAWIENARNQKEVSYSNTTDATKHSCIWGVNNWAKDFCTISQFYDTKTGKIDELWRLALISLGWCCKTLFSIGYTPLLKYNWVRKNVQDIRLVPTSSMVYGVSKTRIWKFSN